MNSKSKRNGFVSFTQGLVLWTMLISGILLVTLQGKSTEKVVHFLMKGLF